jgi:hypothetical protein
MEMRRTCGQDEPGETGIRHDSLGPENRKKKQMKTTT